MFEKVKGSLSKTVNLEIGMDEIRMKIVVKTIKDLESLKKVLR